MFDPEKLYLPDDPALRVLATPKTMARWRREESGPPFVQLHNGRIAYSGKDLNDWLNSCRVVPGKATRPSMAAHDGAAC